MGGYLGLPLGHRNSHRHHKLNELALRPDGVELQVFANCIRCATRGWGLPRSPGRPGRPQPAVVGRWRIRGRAGADSTWRVSGTRLLTRTTRSVTPTEEGMAYYQRACVILQPMDEVESQLRKGTSASTCPWPWAGSSLRPRFAAFSRATPRPRSNWDAPTGPWTWCSRGWTAHFVAGSCRTRGCQPAVSETCALRCVPHRTTSSSTDCPAQPTTSPTTIRSGGCLRRPARCDP
jgi:hypothetical protein